MNSLLALVSLKSDGGSGGGGDYEIVVMTTNQKNEYEMGNKYTPIADRNIGVLSMKMSQAR